MKFKRLSRVLPLVALLSLCNVAHADDGSVKEAGGHFTRGVSLYNEADYRAALVEFRKAYEIAPNVAVLYNIGQAYLQLRNYGAALTNFERYKKEAGANATHAQEVDKSIETLRTRVGYVRVLTNEPGAEILVDDELVGKAPQDKLLVSIGSRKITVVKKGAAPQSRSVDVAVGDVQEVSFIFELATGNSTGTQPQPQPQPQPEKKSSVAPIIAWTATGLLTAGAVTTGFIALDAQSSLKDAEGKLGTTRVRLDDLHSRMQTFAITTDILGGAAIIAGVAAIYFTFFSSSKSDTVGLSVAPNGAVLHGSF
jgi:tetratricopeptide (TPR) repeat protein